MKQLPCQPVFGSKNRFCYQFCQQWSQRSDTFCYGTSKIDIFVTSASLQAVLQAALRVHGAGSWRLPVVLRHIAVNQGPYQRGLQGIFWPLFQRDKQGWRYRVHHGHVTCV